MNDSLTSMRVSPPPKQPPALPDTAADFAEPEASITSVTVLEALALDGLIRSIEDRSREVGSIKLALIDTTGPDGSLFGIASENSIPSVSYIDPITTAAWSN